MEGTNNMSTIEAEVPAPTPMPTPSLKQVIGEKEAEKDKFSIPLVCSLSGLFLGKFIPSNGLAVATPYVTAWKQTAFLHPIFSMKLPELIHRANACWNLEKSGTRTFPMQHKQLLMLAMLHASGCIKQDVPALPSPKLVEVHFMSVVEMLGWKQEVNSDRLSFPRLHIWKGAAKEDEASLFGNVPNWLRACADCKDDYENIVRTRQKAAKVKARELALKSIRKSAYADISLKRLWNWVTTQVPQMILENNPDLEQLFFCEESQIHNWQKEDIEAIEDLVLSHCELGNSISHEVSKRIRLLAEWRATYYDTFEIVVETTAFDALRGTPEPTPGSFPTRGAYLVAHARWKLGNKEKVQRAEEKQKMEDSL